MSFGKRNAPPITAAAPANSTNRASIPSAAHADLTWESVASEQDAVLGTAYVDPACVVLHIMDAKDRLLDGNEELVAAFHGQALAREAYGIAPQTKGGLSLHDYLIVTDRRVITWARGIFKQSVDSYYFNDISSVEATNGMLMGEIVLNVRGAKERFRNMVTSQVPIAERMIQQRISSNRGHGAKPTPATELSPSQIFEKLDALGKLRDSGLVSETEFETKKAELLAKL